MNRPNLLVMTQRMSHPVSLYSEMRNVFNDLLNDSKPQRLNKYLKFCCLSKSCFIIQKSYDGHLMLVKRKSILS